MNRKFLLGLFITVILAVIAVGCSSSDGGEKKKESGESSSGDNTVVIALGSDPQDFNGNVSTTGDGYWVEANIMSSLVASDEQNVIPDLAKEWEVSEDGLTYTFYLEEAVKWHDGEPFTSKDVKWTIDTVIEKKGFVVEQISAIENVETPDDHTVVFELSHQDSAILSVLPQVKILPAHIYEGTDWVTNPANKEPIGTGPFKFVEHKQNQSVILEANEDYYKGAPKIDRLIFSIIPDENTVVQAFLNGEVDIIDYSSALSPGAVPELEKTEGVNVIEILSNSRQYMVVNFDKEPYNDLRVRQALAYAIDRDELVSKAHKGFAEKAEGFFTPTVDWAYNDEDIMPERDIEKAKQLLDEAGLIEDSNGVRMEIELVMFEFPVFSDIAKVVQANLKEIGVESTITTLEYAAWDEKVRSGDFDVTILSGGWGIDPDGLFSRVGSRGAMNLMNYSNEEIDELLEEGLKLTEQDERAEVYKEIQKLMSEDLPVIPLTEWVYLFAIKDYISGHPSDLVGEIGQANYSRLEINR